MKATQEEKEGEQKCGLRITINSAAAAASRRSAVGGEATQKEEEEQKQCGEFVEATHLTIKIDDELINRTAPPVCKEIHVCLSSLNFWGYTTNELKMTMNEKRMRKDEQKREKKMLLCDDGERRAT